MFKDLDGAPFDGIDGSLRQTLANPIDEIMKQIERAEASEGVGA
jgi:hypothetical protein